MLQILYSSGGLFATKMGLKTPFEIRIVTKFYGMYRHYPHKFTHFFVVPDVLALFNIFSEKKRNMIFRKWGGGSKAVWNFSENSSVLEGLGFPKTAHTVWRCSINHVEAIDVFLFHRGDILGDSYCLIIKVSHTMTQTLLVEQMSIWSLQLFLQIFCFATWLIL